MVCYYLGTRSDGLAETFPVSCLHRTIGLPVYIAPQFASEGLLDEAFQSQRAEIRSLLYVLILGCEAAAKKPIFTIVSNRCSDLLDA